MNKKRLIAINFDLDTKKLKDVYVSLTGKKYNRAYYDIKSFMKKNGFSHRQGSGYISKEPMTEMTATLAVKKMGNLMPWLKECTKKIDLTIVGNQFDLTDVLKTKANNNPKQSQNATDKSITTDKNDTHNERNNNIEEKYNALSEKYNDLVKEYEALIKSVAKKDKVIDTTNLVLNEHPELKEEFKKAKAETLQRKTEQEKRKGGPNDKSVKNELSEHKPKKHNKKL